MIARNRLRLILVLFFLILMTSSVAAQDEAPAEATPEVAEEPVVVEEPLAPEITEEAVPAPTEEPTADPTEAPPEVTEEPVVVEESPAPEASEEPEQTTEPDIPTPDIVSAPPVFEIAASLTAEAGQPLRIPLAVYDEQGAVVITQMVSVAGAQTALEIAAPIQDSPPYATTGVITYTPAETASGTDTLTLTAVDGAGSSATTVVQIDIRPVPIVEVTEEATAEATVEAPAEATAEATQQAAPTVERIISYNSNASEESIQSMLAALQAKEVSRIPQIGAMKVLVPEVFADASQAMAAIQGDQAAVMAGVLTFEENFSYHINAQSGFFNPNDPEFTNGTQWSLLNFPGSVNGQDAWTRAKQDGTGVLIAVVDTGVDYQHPDLNGKIDKAKAWDFINDDNNADDDHDPASGVGGHGTHIAGIIAAKTNNSQFMAGLAYNAKIIPVKVCNANNNCPVYEVAAGIVHAVDKGARIINLSLGGSTISTTVQGAVQYAISRNVTVIAGAGNTGGTALQYPASFPGVISVAAHDINGNIAPFSTQNSSVDVSGPGVNIYSLARLEEGGATLWSGTSTAAAHIAGAAALLYADNVARTPDTIREALVCSAVDAGAPEYDNAFGYGRVQADAAMIWRSSSDCRIPARNDYFAKATVIKTIPFSVTQRVFRRSVTTDPNDPTDCGTPTQTLWYKFIPPVDNHYQISSFGSTYNTRLAVYQGVPGAFVRQDVCGVLSLNGGSYVSLDMKKGQAYYIVLSTVGSAVFDGVAWLDIRSTLSNNGSYDDNNNAFRYRGDWARVTVAGKKVMQTFENQAVAVFTFQGASFELYRVVAPNQGSIEVWINNQQFDFNTSSGGIQNLDNTAAVPGIEPQLITIPNPFHGKQNTVIIRRSNTGPTGPIAFDRVVIFNTELKTFTGKVDDRDPNEVRISYFLFWEKIDKPGMYRSTGSRTDRENGAVRAAVKGSTIIIYRNIAPTYGSMDVYVDGAFWGTVDNTHPGGEVLSVPFAITNLTPDVHLLRLVNRSNSILLLDAIEGRTTGAFAPNTINSPGDSRALRSGPWLPPAPVGGGKKAYIPNATTSRMDFNFKGNAFCFAFMRRTDGGTVHVYVDNMNTPHSRVSTNTNPNAWGGHFWPPDILPNSNIQLYCTGATFAEGLHHVRLLFPSGSPVWLTELQFGRFGILTSKSGLVQENDSRLPTTESLYNTPAQAKEMAKLWKRIQFKSQGGAKAQGGYVKRATFDPPPTGEPVIRFYMHGSGFIIYTTSGPDAGIMTVRVCHATNTEDCVLADIRVENANQNGEIDLSVGSPNRERPFAYAVTGLQPGIYLIKIYASGSGNEYVDFDAVRVLP